MARHIIADKIIRFEKGIPGHCPASKCVESNIDTYRLYSESGVFIDIYVNQLVSESNMRVTLTLTCSINESSSSV